ncbi:conserved hypothetical protein [Microsporum canis CBS 113480]|uniref:Uncharacterized protein n=1 Tax=Arthroderma otae (strain ATCC MYA-4605 / CBS 113480) TaxID=554155 RepID=C5FC23_ARTOC|nr:conserved hypothetical protein [Microsporum canis CBS 113480]EEQ27446.1 conserved hypothetical protein [Microsporum canis CBS 113480]
METAMRAHNASFPINMPSKAPAGANYYPVSRIAGSPPEVSDVSTTTGSASGEYDSSAGYSGVDVIDTLNDRMSNVFDPSRLDQGIAKQTHAMKAKAESALPKEYRSASSKYAYPGDY